MNLWQRVDSAIKSNVGIQLFKTLPDASVVIGQDKAYEAVKETIITNIRERIVMLKEQAKVSYKPETRNGLNGIALYLEAMLVSWEKQ